MTRGIAIDGWPVEAFGKTGSSRFHLTGGLKREKLQAVGFIRGWYLPVPPLCAVFLFA